MRLQTRRWSRLHNGDLVRMKPSSRFETEQMGMERDCQEGDDVKTRLGLDHAGKIVDLPPYYGFNMTTNLTFRRS
jgi:hypothetical protein